MYHLMDYYFQQLLRHSGFSYVCGQQCPLNTRRHCFASEHSFL